MTHSGLCVVAFGFDLSLVWHVQRYAENICFLVAIILRYLCFNVYSPEQNSAEKVALFSRPSYFWLRAARDTRYL